MGFDTTLLEDINPFPSHEADGWSESSAGRRTLTHVLEQIEGDVVGVDQRREQRRRPWLVAVAAAAVVVVAVAIPAVILRSSPQRDAPGGGDAPTSRTVVRLGAGHVWPTEGRQVSPEVLASSFAAELLGWANVSTTIEPGSDPSGPVWVTMQQPGLQELEVLTAPSSEGARVVYQVGEPPSVRAIEPGQALGWRIDLAQPNGAVSADLTIRTFDTTVVFSAGATDLLQGYIETTEDLDPRQMESMLVRYWNAEGEVVAAAGGTFGAEPDPTTLTVEETQQIHVWINQLGLNQTDSAVWRDRFDRMCGEGVWNPDVALALSSQFIATDLDAGASVRSEGIGPPSVEDGATALWLMAINTCRDKFPEGAVKQGPPSFDGVGAPGSS